MNLLFDFYGLLLNEKQYKVTELYYGQDFSLTEIAELNGQTKQAISDLLKRSEKKLESFESKMQLAARFEKKEAIYQALQKKYAGDSELLASLKELQEIDN